MQLTVNGQRREVAAATLAQALHELGYGQAHVATALNGAQVAALVEIALKVATGELPRDSAKAIARAAFPLVSEELIDAIFDSIIPKPPAEEQPQEEEKAAA